MKLGLSLALALMATPCLAASAPGVASLSDPSGQERPLALSIWYPSDEPASGAVGGTAVFTGTSAALKAPLPARPLPLVMVSHGGLRSAADSGAWLSASLAQAGFLVVEVNAPRPDTAARALDEVWRRPQDIRRALDLMLADGVWSRQIDRSRISVVGFALGATAALSVAGAEIDGERYVQSCAAAGGIGGPDCQWYAAQGISLTQTNMERLAQPMRDQRVTAAVAVDPEYLAAFQAAPADVGTLLLSLGTGEAVPGSGRFARSAVLSGASVFDIFATCTAAGPDLLREEEGDASLCGASPDARAIAHREISEAILSFLTRGGE